jgi:hypothetical protein
MGAEPCRHAAAVTCIALAFPATAQDFASESGLQEALARRLEAEVIPTCALAGFAGEKTVVVKACTAGASAPARSRHPAARPREVAGVGGLRVTTKEMMRLAEALAGRRASPLEDAIRRSREALFAPPGGRGVAYAWVIVPRADGPVFWHNRSTAGFHAMLAFSPSSRRAAYVVADSPANLDDLALHLVDPALPLKAKRIAIALEEATIDEYVSRYELRPGFVLAVTREGSRILTQATGQGPVEVFAEAKARMFARAIDAQLVIRRDAHGKVEGLTPVQGGREMPARRLS